MFFYLFAEFIYTSQKFTEHLYNQRFELCICYLTPLYLDFCSVLSYGFWFFVFPFWLSFYVCFYVLSKVPKSLGLISVDLWSRCPVAQTWEGFSCRPNLAQASTLLGPPVKIQPAIYRSCAYSFLKRLQSETEASCLSSVSLSKEHLTHWKHIWMWLG